MSLHLTYPQKYPDIFYSKECLFLDAVDGTAAGTARLVDALISLTLLFTVIHIGNPSVAEQISISSFGQRPSPCCPAFGGY